MKVLYTDNDPQICAWAEELVKAQLVPHGTVLCKSITDLQPEDLAGYTQVHLFAGILGWPYALRLAGWPDDVGVWSGSCPCQPFSCAGQRKGSADKRHLWPEMRRLIEQCRPPVIFGEQVASKDGRLWFSGVRTDLEALGYAIGASDLCAAGVGAPNIRQRLFWVAFAGRSGRERLLRGPASGAAANGSETCLASGGPSNPGGLANPAGSRHQWPFGRAEGEAWDQARLLVPSQHVQTSFWSSYDLIPCADGKARRVRSGSFPLAHGAPARVVRLRGYGNAINPELAAEFIQASIEAISEITVDCRISG